MAIVSVEGGPSRESMDSVFRLLKGNVQCTDEDELLDNDEVSDSRGVSLVSASGGENTVCLVY